MLGNKKHIALFLLAGFLLPQVANGVHYFVIAHTPGSFHGEEEVTAPAYEYHSCDYQLTGWNFFIPPLRQFQSVDQPEQRNKLNFSYSLNIVNELAFHYSLRGPPENRDC